MSNLSSCIQPKLHLRSYQLDTQEHVHDYGQYTFALGLTSSLAIEIGGRADLVDAGCAAFIAPGEQHCYSSSPEDRFLVLDYPWGESVFSNQPFWRVDPLLDKFLAFVDHFSLRQKSSDALQPLCDVLINMLAQRGTLNIDPRVLEAKKWLDSNFHLAISLPVLAKRVYLGEDQLQRKFKAHFTVSLADYWRGKRIARAEFLLSTTRLSIQLIAQRVGYADASSLNRAFQKANQCTPKQWRRKSLAVNFKSL